MGENHRMKLFQFNQKNFKAMGADLNESDSKWNWINVLNVIGFGHMFIVRGAFILFEAQTVVEYGLAFYPFVTAFTAGLTVLIGVWKRKNVARIIQKFEKFIEKSNWHRSFGFVFEICELNLFFRVFIKISQEHKIHIEKCMMNCMNASNEQPNRFIQFS